VDRSALNQRKKEAESRGLTADTPIRDEKAKLKAELTSG
jgi:hypothetical protein